MSKLNRFDGQTWGLSAGKLAGNETKTAMHAKDAAVEAQQPLVGYQCSFRAY